MFRLKLFGSASIEGPDGPLTGRAVQRRRLALLALLSIARQGGMTRERLIGYLWPDSDPDRARHLLSDSVYRINHALGGDALISAGDELRLDPQRLPSDAWQFADAIDRRDWERAVALHAAPFLDGFFLTAADELERWVDGQRERLARERARAVEALARTAEDEGALSDAVHWWRALAVQDPHSSRIALALMRVLERTGDRAAALRHARVHTLLLESELGVAPDAALLAFADELRRPPAPSAAPATTPAASRTPIAPAIDATTAHSWHAPAGATAFGRPQSSLARRRSKRLAAAGLAFALIAAVAVTSRQRIQSFAEEEPPAIVVLPFADLSAEGGYEYFADGITEELAARLAQVPGLSVVGRTSAFALKGSAIDAREIAHRLDVTTVLEGSVRYSGDRLRIVAQLIDARNGYQLWTQTYEREVADVFVIQEEIARMIVTHLRGRLTGADETLLASDPGATVDAEAFNLYLKGRFQWHKRTEQSVLAATGYFRQAVARAPDYARAHAGLGDAYAISGFYDYLPPRDAFPAAAAAARRALELQPSLGEPHATLAYVALYHDWNWPLAEREFARAIELSPGYSTAHQWHANYLTAMGRFDEAIAAMGEAMSLDPLSLIANAAYGWVLYHEGEYQLAVDQLTHALELDSQFALAYLWRGLARQELGDMTGALRDIEEAVRLSGGSSANVALLAHAHARAGNRDSAMALMSDLRARAGRHYVPAYELAKVHLALGDIAAALVSLERAYDDRSHSIAFLAVDPQLKGLHSEPQFQRLLERVRLKISEP